MKYRKTTLREALVNSRSYSLYLNQFLDDFYSSDRKEKERLIKFPPETRDKKMLALADAVASTLAGKYQIKKPPWTGRYGLEIPWFVISLEGYKPTLVLQAPGEFRCRNIFVPENFLERV